MGRLTLRAWRRAKEITQEKMAELLDVATPTYISWEQNPENIKVSNAYKIADVLGVDISDIIFC